MAPVTMKARQRAVGPPLDMANHKGNSRMEETQS